MSVHFCAHQCSNLSCSTNEYSDETNILHNNKKYLEETPHISIDRSYKHEISPVKLSLTQEKPHSRRALAASITKNLIKTVSPQRVCHSKIRVLKSDAEFYELFELQPSIVNNVRCNERVTNQLKDGAFQKQWTHRARIHEVWDKKTLTLRIVKIINKAKLPASTGGEKLWRRLCHKLLHISSKHPGMMTITDVLESNQNFYLITEKLDGGELFEFLLYEKAVPEELCKYLIKQILQALDYMHSSFLLHRDVKPENLMFRRSRPVVDGAREYMSSDATFNKKGRRVLTSLECSKTMTLEELSNTFELAIIDFDTCKMTDVFLEDDIEVHNGRRRLVGTYGYLAPEVLKGYEYTRVSDLWSVGIILYILITGAPPVPMELMTNAQTSLEILESIRCSGIDFQLSPFPEFPKAQSLCRALLEFEPSQRMSSAFKALQHPWLQSTASNAVPVSIPISNICSHCQQKSKNSIQRRKIAQLNYDQ